MRRQGFTDRSFEAGAHPYAPRDDKSQERLELVLNLHEERARSILVSRTDDEVGDTRFLPRVLISIEPLTSLASRGVTIRIKCPRWLAEREGLVSAAGEGQGDLF